MVNTEEKILKGNTKELGKNLENTNIKASQVDLLVMPILPDLTNKYILDACCGGRMMWFNKKHPKTLYNDNRVREKGHSQFRPNHTVKPDCIYDFRDMPFEDNTFKLVVFDPPHIFGKENSLINQYYGCLDKNNWKQDIKQGFKECFRVLDIYGTLIFKWNEARINKKEILDLIDIKPLFGHQVGSRLKTHWMTFMKFPDEN